MFKSQREALLDKIRAYEFAALELNLFLNSNPNNRRALSDFNNLVRTIKALKCEYERLYGPLVNFGFGCSNYPWQWINDPWPWEYDFKMEG